MNQQNAGERFNGWDFVERTERDADLQVAVSDPLAREVPVEAAPIDETPEAPIDRTIVHEEPVAQMVPDEIALNEPATDESRGSRSIPSFAPMVETTTPQATIGTDATSSSTLMDGEGSQRLRSRWNEIQGQFVDEPRAAVQQADALVSEVVEQITQKYANEHGALKSQWNQGTDVSTEDLRKVLQRYRSFFSRLVV